MKILSWNIKQFTAIVRMHGNAYDVLKQVMKEFDLISIYEVPNSANGNAAVATLVHGSPIPAKRGGAPPAVPGLNDLPPAHGAAAFAFSSFTEPSLGKDNENDQVAIIWNTATCNVVNNTTARRGSNSYGSGRQPVYYNVTETATHNKKEFVSWHAPSPDGEASHCIAQTWQQILFDAVNGVTKLTTLIMGDFNSMPTATGGDKNPAKKRLRGASTSFQAEITPGNLNGTTLKATYPFDAITAIDCRTNNTYDQFYLDHTMVTAVGAAGIYDIIRRLNRDELPLNGRYGAQYNGLRNAYSFYVGSISDHLPVALNVTL
ncbi:MAG TPA: hypothetical protein VJ810_22070 [Blastocatellia bacterium]|nr:hypothetical protein [Blastocatellia bacterium]